MSLAILLGRLHEGPKMAIGRFPVRLDLLVFLYPLGTALTGALVGLFKPIIRPSFWRAAILGVVVALPWSTGVTLTIYSGHADWRVFHSVHALLFALIFGVFAGQLVRED